MPCAAGQSGLSNNWFGPWLSMLTFLTSSRSFPTWASLNSCFGCCSSAGPLAGCFSGLGEGADGVVAVEAVAEPRPSRPARARTPTARK